ncbi:Uncharacterised protein [Legionella busanensis]|uniref:Uncharacterized protein n=1 Tax=Legionella busanensis TaxID=190655 RepID=A0A378JHV8_9GAMM|nr:hypothetical protein [Legionella busanensis]STX50351.1 Uncharacterised protein [Legionella busanensis]
MLDTATQGVNSKEKTRKVSQPKTQISNRYLIEQKIIQALSSLFSNKPEAVRQVLIEQADAYMKWQNNKSESSRYNLGLFTRLRHTKLGVSRAKGFKTALKAPDNVVKVFKGHLFNCSTIHNHSLDTFLIEGIAQLCLMDLNLGSTSECLTKENRGLIRDILRNLLNIMDESQQKEIHPSIRPTSIHSE